MRVLSAIRPALTGKKRPKDKKVAAKKLRARRLVAPTITPPPPPPPPPFDVAMQALLEQGIGPAMARLLLLDNMSDEQLQGLRTEEFADMLSAAQTNNEHSTQTSRLLRRLSMIADPTFDQAIWVLTAAQKHLDCACGTNIAFNRLRDLVCANATTHGQKLQAVPLLRKGYSHRYRLIKDLWEDAVPGTFQDKLAVFSIASERERSEHKMFDLMLWRNLDDFLKLLKAVSDRVERLTLLETVLRNKRQPDELKELLLALTKSDTTDTVEKIIRLYLEHPFTDDDAEDVLDHLVEIEFAGDPKLTIPFLNRILCDVTIGSDLADVINLAIRLKSIESLQAMLPMLNMEFREWHMVANCLRVTTSEISEEGGVFTLTETLDETRLPQSWGLSIISMMFHTAGTYYDWATVHAYAHIYFFHAWESYAKAKFAELIAEESSTEILQVISIFGKSNNPLIAVCWEELSKRANDAMPALTETEPTGGESGK